ncbi:MAG: insulinase family protein [Candidatus Glassbacteria bacterium]|nr:insulinase family protein [Candidatus Glassbacteria bacterium]
MHPYRLTRQAACLIFALVVSCGSALAQKGPKEQFEFPPLNPIRMPEIREVTLGNGLRLFLLEDHDYPTIGIRGRLYTGSIYESPAKVGLASITGTVLRTGGTTHISGDEIDKELETMAASIETYIGDNSGGISASMLKDDAGRCLELMADILMNPVFSEDKIELAKVQMKTGIARRNDDVGQIARREFEKLIYGAAHPYARQTEYATVDAITRDDMVAFYQAYFQPNNMMMAVWGDFRMEEMVERIKQVFGGWSGRPVELPAKPEVKAAGKFNVNYIEKTDVNQSNIMIGHLGGLMNNPDFPALTVMNNILSWDRMFKKIRTDEGLAYHVWGYYGANYDYPGVFSAGAQTKSESTVRAIELILEEMKKMAAEEVTDKELEKAKDRYLNSFVFNFDSQAEIINRMLTYTYFGYPLDFAEQIKSGVEKVDKADIQRVARKYLRPGQVSILVVGNKKEFDKPLSSLGQVRVIDITIPPPAE